jgi:hypothetical protein
MTAGNIWLFGIDDGNFIRAQVHTHTADGFRTACCAAVRWYWNSPSARQPGKTNNGSIMHR